MSKNDEKELKSDGFEKLLQASGDAIPLVGDIIFATVSEITKKAVRFNISGFRSGVVRGMEILRDPQFVADLKVGDRTSVRVLELDNENGEVELAFADSTESRTWERFRGLQEKGEIIEVTISDANRGGLIIELDNVSGFMPVSQLRPENYPRVSGADPEKILRKLKSFVGKKMKVKTITASPEENKLVFSEKAVWEDEYKNELKKFKIGDVIEGQITALADFGAFIKFHSPEPRSDSAGPSPVEPRSDSTGPSPVEPRSDSAGFGTIEGLIHVSEISWQKIGKPSDVLKVGETVKAKVMGISGSKIFLSTKRMTEDPWKNINEKFKVGDIVKGKVAKINPFGFIVELTPEIFGLAHVSELSSEIAEPSKIAKVGDEMEFKIVSIEPEYRKLGLSLKALKETEEQPVTPEPVDEGGPVTPKLSDLSESEGGRNTETEEQSMSS